MPSGLSRLIKRDPAGRASWLSIFAALALLGAMVFLSRDFGATWDERFQQKYGERVWDYWQGRLPASDFVPAPQNEYLYGGLVEVIAVATERAIRTDVYVVRHMVVSVFGWTGIVFTGLLAGRLYNRRAGWLAAALLTISPRFFADAMNNPKDVPFAALTMAALYYTLTAHWGASRPPLSGAAKLALAIALAINIRPLGLMLLVFAAGYALAVAGRSAIIGPRPVGWRTLGMTSACIAGIALVAIPSGTLTWPWAQQQPLTRPLEAFRIVSQLNWAQGFDVLYRGESLAANELPWHYVPVWLAISLPPVVLAGLALMPSLAARRNINWLPLLALAAFAATPMAAAIVQHATLYDGIRHLSFVIPPLIVLSATGWCASFDILRPQLRAALLLLLAIGLAEPLIFQLRNHPNQNVYFSPLIGGPRAAFARYDMDYWGNSMLQAVKWSADLADRAGMPLVITGNPPQLVEADVARFHSLMFTPRSVPNYHLDVRLMRGPRESLEEFAARPDVLYRVTTADGAPLCVVLPGPAFGRLEEQLRATEAHRTSDARHAEP